MAFWRKTSQQKPWFEPTPKNPTTFAEAQRQYDYNKMLNTSYSIPSGNMGIAPYGFGSSIRQETKITGREWQPSITQCPNCAHHLAYQALSQTYWCSYCNQKFTAEFMSEAASKAKTALAWLDKQLAKVIQKVK